MKAIETLIIVQHHLKTALHQFPETKISIAGIKSDLRSIKHEKKSIICPFSSFPYNLSIKSMWTRITNIQPWWINFWLKEQNPINEEKKQWVTKNASEGVDKKIIITLFKAVITKPSTAESSGDPKLKPTKKRIDNSEIARIAKTEKDLRTNKIEWETLSKHDNKGLN